LVSLDSPETLPALRKIITKLDIHFPVLYDGGYFESIPAAEWGVHGVPSAFLINPQGVIMTKSLGGELSEDTLGKKLDFYINHPQPVLGLRASHKVNDDGTLTVLANVMNAGRQPLELNLSLSLTKLIWDASDPTLPLVDQESSFQADCQKQTVSFSDFSETTCEFVLTPAADWHVVNYSLRAMVPGSVEAIGEYGLSLGYASDDVMLVDLQWADGCWHYVPHPEAQLREYIPQE